MGDTATGSSSLSLSHCDYARANATLTAAATDASGNVRTRTVHVIAPKKAGDGFTDCDDKHRVEKDCNDDEDRDNDDRDQGGDDDEGSDHHGRG